MFGLFKYTIFNSTRLEQVESNEYTPYVKASPDDPRFGTVNNSESSDLLDDSEVEISSDVLQQGTLADGYKPSPLPELKADLVPKKEKKETSTIVEKSHVLYVQGLHKRYGRKIVLRGVDFAIKSSEIVGFLGPNGAGKTTSFYSIMGFIRPNKGRIFLDEKDITNMPMYRRARLGISYLPQEASVFRRMSVEENLMVVLNARLGIRRRERKEIAHQLLNDLGIWDKRRQSAQSLSGGERRRTEIARALALDPKFLLLDEPFAGIDPKAVYEIKGIILHLAERGIGVLITDHNVRDTLEITSHSYIISDGQVAVSGSREEIMANELARSVYLGHSFEI